MEAPLHDHAAAGSRPTSSTMDPGLKAIDLEVEWDPLFRQSCVALWRNECEALRIVTGDSPATEAVQQPARVSSIYFY